MASIERFRAPRNSGDIAAKTATVNTTARTMAGSLPGAAGDTGVVAVEQVVVGVKRVQRLDVGAAADADGLDHLASRPPAYLVAERRSLVAVQLHDRAADRKSQAHAADRALGRAAIELGKELLRIAVGQALLLVETDKANVEIPSPFAGTVTDILVAVGEEVATGMPTLAIEA